MPICLVCGILQMLQRLPTFAESCLTKQDRFQKAGLELSKSCIRLEKKNKKLTNQVTISSPSKKLRSKFRIHFGTATDAALD